MLRRAVLYTSCEPCAMCAGNIYRAGIRSVMFARSSTQLAAFAGADSLGRRAERFSRAADPVTIAGPFALEEARAVHAGYWSPFS